MKKKIKEYLNSWSEGDIEIDSLMHSIEEGKKTYNELIFSVELDDEYSSRGYPYLRLYGLREETDQEYNKRMKEEEERKEKNLEWQRKQYEDLKKKFEK